VNANATDPGLSGRKVLLQVFPKSADRKINMSANLSGCISFVEQPQAAF
jgi:hypothetical protein